MNDPLDNRLKSIESKLDQALLKIEFLGSLEGPIGRLREEVIRNVQRIESAHGRIDAHDILIDRIGVRQWEMVVKSAAILGGGSGLLFIIYKIGERFFFGT